MSSRFRWLVGSAGAILFALDASAWLIWADLNWLGVGSAIVVLGMMLTVLFLALRGRRRR